MKKVLVLTVIMAVAIDAVCAARVWAMQNTDLPACIASSKIRIAVKQPPLVKRQDVGIGKGSLHDNPVDTEGYHRMLLASRGGRRRIQLPDGEEQPADEDGDGVPDYLDACPDTPRGASINEQGCWVITGAHFDPGKWQVKQGLYPVLDEIVTILKGNPSLMVEIQGHTDNTGSEAHNLVLSHRRACAVMDYLVSKGVKSARLLAGGYGSSKPVASNKTTQGRAKNRRVELVPIP
ncbi:MAG: OmpA family protein [bacterium]